MWDKTVTMERVCQARCIDKMQPVTINFESTPVVIHCSVNRVVYLHGPTTPVTTPDWAAAGGTLACGKDNLDISTCPFAHCAAVSIGTDNVAHCLDNRIITGVMSLVESVGSRHKFPFPLLNIARLSESTKTLASKIDPRGTPETTSL